MGTMLYMLAATTVSMIDFSFEFKFSQEHVAHFMARIYVFWTFLITLAMFLQGLVKVKLKASSLRALSLVGCRNIISLELSCPVLQSLHLDGCNRLVSASFSPVSVSLSFLVRLGFALRFNPNYKPSRHHDDRNKCFHFLERIQVLLVSYILH